MFVSFANNKSIGEPGDKAVAIGHLSHELCQKNRVSLLIMPILPRLVPLVTTHRLPLSNDEISNFSRLRISLHGVVRLDEGIRVADGTNDVLTGNEVKKALQAVVH